MKQDATKVNETTQPFRIDKDVLQKIRAIVKTKGQTISGYINVNLQKSVERDWKKFEKKAV